MQKRTRKLLNDSCGLGFLLAPLLTLSACSSNFPLGAFHASSDTLYHHNWWNYYKRGSEFLEQGEIKKAQEDFERSLGLRPGAKYGYDQDTWRARTYGLHFLEGYFPNRELAVCLFRLGNFKDAEMYLEKSLEGEPSGRAKFYLNETHRELLKTAKVLPAEILPDLKDVTWTSRHSIDISGRVVAEGYVHEIEIAGRSQFIELAEKDKVFRERVDLHRGDNRISVRARDLAHQAARRMIRVMADWQSPELFLDRVEQRAGSWYVRGFCRDDLGLAEVWLVMDGVRGEVNASGNTARVEVSIRRGQSVILEARDRGPAIGLSLILRLLFNLSKRMASPLIGPQNRCTL